MKDFGLRADIVSLYMRLLHQRADVASFIERRESLSDVEQYAEVKRLYDFYMEQPDEVRRSMAQSSADSCESRADVERGIEIAHLFVIHGEQHAKTLRNIPQTNNPIAQSVPAQIENISVTASDKCKP